MVTTPDTPSDAPLGPIVRFVRRLSIGDGVTRGGALGCEAVSPRLRGWMEQAGIDLTGLSRWMNDATAWALATPRALRQAAVERDKYLKTVKKAALAPMFRALWEARSEEPGRAHGKAWLCREAAAILAGNAGDEDAEACASDVIQSGILGDSLPTAKTLEDWFTGESVDAMLTGDGASADDWD